MVYSAAIHTLGCKVNSYESDAMERLLTEAGFRFVPFDEPADVYIVNTCSVTNIADRKSRQMLHRARTQNPEAVIAAVGCFAQAEGEKLLDDAADLVLGNEKKSHIVPLITAFLENRRKTAEVTDMTFCRSYDEMPANCSEHTRAFLKIEDGCNQFCSYCRIPYVRGRVRSRSEEAVLEEARRLLDGGFKELVLTGIHLSSYGLDSQGDAGTGASYGLPLLKLLEKLDGLPGLARIRLGSLEPRIITEENAARLKAISHLCPHFHLSLQSGCDGTLLRMNRRYTADEFYEKMCLLRDTFDRPALTTDVIVGFPGETEEEFESTFRFLEKASFYETHIFKYSRRSGTVADRLPGQLTDKQKTARAKRLAELNAVNKDRYCAAFFGEAREVLLEEQLPDGRWAGFTPEYVRLAEAIPGAASGELRSVEVSRSSLIL